MRPSKFRSPLCARHLRILRQVRRCALGLTAMAGLLATPSFAAQVWLSGVDAYAQPNNPSGSAFMQLFEPDAQWNAAAARVQVFKVSTQFLHRATDAEISAVIDGLRRRNIALAMEGLMLPASVRCGNGVEGYSGPHVMEQIADRVKRLGGAIRYVAMDEPVWFGNHQRGQNSCHDSVEALAQQMAPNVHTLKTAFPAIEFGDIEPINDHTRDQLSAMLEFARAFQTATGEKLAFVHADIIWENSWQPQLIEWAARLRSAGMRFGVVFNGDPRDDTDTGWTAHAADRYAAVMSDPRMRPDQAVFQTWMPRPTRTVPDSEAGTLTSVVVDALGRK